MCHGEYIRCFIIVERGDDELKFLVVSDTHVPTRNRDLPKRVIELMDECDGIIALGDYVSMNVVALFNSHRIFYGVHGNMDEPDVKAYLPQIKRVRLEGVDVGLCHGWGPPWGIKERILNLFQEKPQVVIFGHTHTPCDEVFGGVRFLNPGPAEPGGTLGVLMVKEGRLTFEIEKLPR